MGAFLAITALLACDSTWTCEHVVTDVGDDETELADVDQTVEEGLSRAAQTASLDGEWVGGGATSVTLSLMRAEGRAELNAGTAVSTPGLSHDMMLRACPDVVTVPVQVSASSSDGVLDMTETGELTLSDSFGLETLSTLTTILRDGAAVGTLWTWYDDEGLSDLTVRLDGEKFVAPRD